MSRYCLLRSAGRHVIESPFALRLRRRNHRKDKRTNINMTTSTLLRLIFTAGLSLSIQALTAIELNTPEWQEHSGISSATLRISTPGALAHRVSFSSLHLGKGAQMYLYGVDETGAVRAVHGPYERNGPSNTPDFSSEAIAGATLVIEVKGKRTEKWPFEIEAIEPLHSADGVDLKASYRPAAPERGGVLESGYFRGQLVQYKVVDGEAILQDDIVLGPANDMRAGDFDRKGDGRRNSHIITSIDDKQFRWPMGVMPYTNEFAPDSDIDVRIKEAIAYWNTLFPGTLVPRTSQADYVTFSFKAGVCESRIGRVTGQQFIGLSSNCTRGSVIHEVGHALGLWHEHTRPDRGQYVKINWLEIQEGKAHNFEIPKEGESEGAGAYDFGSIMHYPRTAFSIEGNDTIDILGTVPPGVMVGQRISLSEGDKGGIKKMYCDASLWIMPSTVLVDDGESFFSIKAPPYCQWTVTETTPWIVLTTTKGTGSGTIEFLAASNTLRVQRSGSIKINGRSVSIKQEPR